MKITIEIPTGMYEDIRNGVDGYNNFICTAIRQGAPLPKGSEDCISRQDALNAITMAQVRWQAVEHIKKLPSTVMNEQWQELKETIIELRDNDGTGTQQEVCKFLANLMDLLEKEIEKENEK